MDTIGDIIAIAFFAIMLIFVFLPIICDAIGNSARDRKKLRKEIEDANKYKNEIKKHQELYANKDKTLEDLYQENIDLKNKIAVALAWKEKYEELHKIYYKLYTEYQNNPSATATDLFPTDEDTLSIIKLKTDLNYAEDTIDELHRQISNHKGKLIEADNEIKALEFELEEANSIYTDHLTLKAKYNSLSQSENEYLELLAAHKIILKSFLKNVNLFYDDSKELKKLYSKMDEKRLYRSFDPTLCFREIKYKIGHCDKPDVYETTLLSCSCPDFRDNTKGKQPCKHMIFLAYNIGNMFINKEETEKHFKEDIRFIKQKHKLESEIKKLRAVKKTLEK